MDDKNLVTNIRVAVRCRPLSTKEKNNGEVSYVKISPSNGEVVLVNPANQEEHPFAFDLVFGEDSRQEEVWNSVGSPVLSKAISGYNSTIFAYGQTGSGKTWSMQGGSEGDDRGIIPRMNYALFDIVNEEKKKDSSTKFLITVSYFEIYNEIIFDLLDLKDNKKKNIKNGLEIREHPALGVYVKGLQEIVIDSPEKMESILVQGQKNRTVASTNMNSDSSRSHSIFIIKVHQKDEKDPNKNVFAKINLVDLAGSERQKSTGATGDLLKEGANINKSLSALGNVINALVENGKNPGKNIFIPYRNSKLTRVLQESLGGNSVTSMLAAMSPAACNFDETLSTLKYANRAKSIKIKATKNEEASQIAKLNEEIRLLKEKLAAQQNSDNYQRNNNDEEPSSRNLEQLKELEEAAKASWEERTRLSLAHEEEKAKFFQEKLQQQQQLALEKEQYWIDLTEKKQVELTITHLKHVTQSLLNNIILKESNNLDISDIEKNNKNYLTSLESDIAIWFPELSSLTSLYKSCSEQFSISQVFKASLEKDLERILIQNKKFTEKQPSNYSALIVDCTAISNSLQHFFDKSFNLFDQISLWFENIENTKKIFTNLQSKINAFLSHNFENNNLSDVSRGLNLILSQLTLSNNDFISSFKNINFMNLELFISSSSSICTDLISFIKPLIQEQTSSNNLFELSMTVENCLSKFRQLQETLLSISSVVNNNSESKSNDFSSESKNSKKNDSKGDSSPILTNLAYKSNCSQTGYSMLPMKESKRYPQVNNQSSFAFVTSNISSPQSLELEVQPGATIKKIYLNDAIFESIVNSKEKARPVSGSKDIPSSSSNELITLIRLSTTPCYALPCEETFSKDLPTTLTIDDCEKLSLELNDSVLLTSILYTNIIQWSGLIKSKSPLQFLKKPPIKFLYDLICFISKNYPNLFPPSLSTPWEIVNQSRETKAEFMENLLKFIESKSGLKSPTTSISIITGSDPHLTNVALQYLSYIIFHHNKYSNSSSSESLSYSRSTPVLAPPVKPSTSALIYGYLESCKVEVSDDKKAWTLLSQENTDSDSKTTSKNIKLSFNCMMESKSIRYIRVTPQNFKSLLVNDDPSLEAPQYLGFNISISGNQENSFAQINQLSSNSDSLGSIESYKGQLELLKIFIDHFLPVKSIFEGLENYFFKMSENLQLETKKVINYISIFLFIFN